MRTTHLCRTLKGKPSTQPQISCGYDLIQYFRPIFLQLKVRPKPDAEYLARTVFPSEGAGKSIAFPLAQLQADRLFAVNLGPCYSFVPSDFSLTSSTSALLVTSTLTSSAYAVYLATSLAPGNVRPRRTGFAFILRRKGYNARIYNMGDNGQPCRIDRVRVKGSDLTPFTSTMTPGDA